MNPEKLGKRLREARLAKKMTQAEVVEGFITRNMLSQIESGVATPSMKTLEFLAHKLEIPLPVLMAEESDDPTERLLTAKEALRMEEYDRVLGLINVPREEDPFYDEYCALLARAYAAIAAAGDASAKAMAEHYAKLGLYK